MNHNALQSDKNYAFINVGLEEKFIASCCNSNKSRAFDLNLHFKIKKTLHWDFYLVFMICFIGFYRF